MISGDMNTHPYAELDLPRYEQQRVVAPTPKAPSSSFGAFSHTTPIFVDPTDDDVLCGKDKATFEHEGNRRFRELVLGYASRYVFCDTQAERVALVKNITEAVRESGGRFIKKDDETGRYYQINERMAREKVRQALRFAGISKDKKDKQSKDHAAGKIFKEAKKYLRTSEARKYLEDHGWMKFLSTYIPAQKKADKANKSEIVVVAKNEVRPYMPPAAQVMGNEKIETVKDRSDRLETSKATSPIIDKPDYLKTLPPLENHEQIPNGFMAAIGGLSAPFTVEHPTMPSLPPLQQQQLHMPQNDHMMPFVFPNGFHFPGDDEPSSFEGV